MILSFLFNRYNGDEGQIKSDFINLVSSWLDKKILVTGGES